MLKNQKLYSLKQEVMDTLINELKTNRIKADNIGQTILSQKLDFLIDVTEKEKVLFEKGFTEFIWHKDLTRYITAVTPNAPVILDLEYYERIIPAANMEDILTAKNLGIFDRLLDNASAQIIMNTVRSLLEDLGAFLGMDKNDIRIGLI